MHQLHLETTSDTAQLKPLRRAVEAFCTACGFDEKAVGEVGLCVNEAMANITRHAYNGATDKPITLHVAFAEKTLIVKLRDWGSGKNPGCVPPKTDPLTPGGLGLVCMRTLMDEVDFAAQSDGMLLTLKKRLPQ